MSAYRTDQLQAGDILHTSLHGRHTIATVTRIGIHTIRVTFTGGGSLEAHDTKL